MNTSFAPLIRKVYLAYLVSHPIQYQAPLLKRISQDTDVELTVFFCSDLSLRQYNDPGFGREIKWDIPLLDGYAHRFLGRIGKSKKINTFMPLNYGLFSALVR